MSDVAWVDFAEIAALTGRGLFLLIVFIAIGFCGWCAFRLAIALVAWSIERKRGW
jgi:hypothetical protein